MGESRENSKNKALVQLGEVGPSRLPQALRLQSSTQAIQTLTHRGKTFIQSTQGQLEKLASQAGKQDDWGQLLKRVGTTQRPGLHKSASESNLQRPARQRRLVGTQLHHASSQPAEVPAWLQALNNTIVQARAAQQPSFQLPNRQSFEQQAQKLVHSASSLSLQSVRDQLLQKPRDALSSAQQTLDTCQQNFQALHSNLQASLAEGRSNLERTMQSLGEPGLPSSSGSRLAALLSPVRGAQQHQQQQQRDAQQLAHEREGEQAEADVLSPWAVLPGYMLARETAAIEALPPEDEEGEAEQPEPSSSGRLWGPFQQQAERRRTRLQGSSLREDGRQVTIVTTAALPWMTGTAVNPLLRAAYLARDRARRVTLMIPWLAKSDQTKIFPNNMTFDTPEEQEQYVRDWVHKRTGFESDFKVTFYPGRYAAEKCSILPVGDPTQYIPEHEADVAILEEPEHLNWYHHGRRWTDKFAHVVGVVHTNYLDYARREEAGDTKEALLRHINSWVCRIHCHKVVKLSDAVQPLPRQTTEFVHGVADSFLAVGEQKSKPPPEGGRRFGKGAYFIGKVVWAKGYTELLELMTKHVSSLGKPLPMDCYGTGEDLAAVRDEAGRRGLGLQFHGAKDHLDTSMHDYQVFINPSTSDVVATTTAEALAMGKWVVCADHPSNRFFSQFQNCLIFRTPEEFSRHVQHALEHEPHPMQQEDRQRLTWEAATERFLNVTELTPSELRPSPMAAAVDNLAWMAHNALSGCEPVRMVVGAGANTRDNPQRIMDYEPAASDVCGLFDDKTRGRRGQALAPTVK